MQQCVTKALGPVVGIVERLVDVSGSVHASLSSLQGIEVAVQESVVVSVQDSVEQEFLRQLVISLAGVIFQVRDSVLESIAGFTRLGDVA